MTGGVTIALHMCPTVHNQPCGSCFSLRNPTHSGVTARSYCKRHSNFTRFYIHDARTRPGPAGLPRQVCSAAPPPNGGFKPPWSLLSSENCSNNSTARGLYVRKLKFFVSNLFRLRASIFANTSARGRRQFLHGLRHVRGMRPGHHVIREDPYFPPRPWGGTGCYNATSS